MSKQLRPSPRSLFLAQPRTLSVKFYTSNVHKYLQAQTIFELYGLRLDYFRSHSDPYTEDYSLGTEALLTNAIDEILASVGKTSLFFVEDTSLRIDALSSPSSDYPGLAVKEWFARTTFKDLDRTLPKDPAERTAVVRSDIGLHVPGLADPVFFHGETCGRVSSSPPDFPANRVHPWLTPDTFNGWFIPAGAERRLGEMSFEESWDFDFRVKSLTQLVYRLEEFAAILNAPREVYATTRQRPAPAQQSLFSRRPTQFIVVGPTCAGKTTFGDIARSAAPNIPVIEASSIVRSFKRRRDEARTPFEFARALLDKQGYDVVARKILSLYQIGPESDFVITGFRTIQELETIKAACPGAKIVFVETSVRTRYARHLKRGRGATMSYKEFVAHDKEQWGFGLLSVAELFADISIANEGLLRSYERQVAAALDPMNQRIGGVSVNVKPRHRLHINRLYRCLRALDTAPGALTCEAISAASSAGRKHHRNAASKAARYTGKRITPNNVNKILKSVPEFAHRREDDGTRIRYEITDTGRAYLRMVAVYAAARDAN